MSATAKTVIVADSDEEVRKQLYLHLVGKGFDVRSAESASGLIQMVEKTTGIILLGLELSGMKAYEMIPILKKINPKLPIIVMSANSSVELAQRIRNEDIFFYAMKPLDVDEIERVVEGAFRRLEHETQPWMTKDHLEN